VVPRVKCTCASEQTPSVEPVSRSVQTGLYGRGGAPVGLIAQSRGRRAGRKTSQCSNCRGTERTSQEGKGSHPS
jgi:hypothetical protein